MTVLPRRLRWARRATRDLRIFAKPSTLRNRRMGVAWHGARASATRSSAQSGGGAPQNPLEP